jgi:hypothetical protein
MWLVPSSVASALEESSGEALDVALAVELGVGAALVVSSITDAAGHVDGGGRLRGLHPDPANNTTPSNADAATRWRREFMSRL